MPKPIFYPLHEIKDSTSFPRTHSRLRQFGDARTHQGNCGPLGSASVSSTGRKAAVFSAEAHQAQSSELVPQFITLVTPSCWWGCTIPLSPPIVFSYDPSPYCQQPFSNSSLKVIPTVQVVCLYSGSFMSREWWSHLSPASSYPPSSHLIPYMA